MSILNLKIIIYYFLYYKLNILHNNQWHNTIHLNIKVIEILYKFEANTKSIPLLSYKNLDLINVLRLVG